MTRDQLIRILCVALVATVLSIALILVVAVCGGATVELPSETEGGFRPSLPSGPFDPGEWLESLDFGDMTYPDIPSDGDVTLPPEPEITLPDWESGMEWPTLPPSLESNPDFEMPTLPDGWDTLPNEWDTLPPEWGGSGDDLPYGPEDLADLLAGMNGNLGMPPGALAAGIASQLTVMDIHAEKSDRVYLKMQSFGAYNGQGWDEAGMYGGAINGLGYSANYLPHYLMNEITPFSGYPLTITPKMEVRVIPYYIVASPELAQLQTSDVKAMGAYDQVYTLYYRPYSTHVHASMAGGELSSFEKDYAEFVERGYLEIDDTTMAYMRLIIEEQGFDKNDPDIIQKVAVYVQNAATYDLAYNQNLDQEPNVALAFLGAYKKGVCRHFATAATLLYRALGIPARYTVGFMTDVTAGESTAVKGMDAHAWVEVYVEGFGWQYVEVTGSPAGSDRPVPPDTDTDTDNTPGTGGDSTEPPVEPSDPTTWGDILAGTNGQFKLSPSIPPSLLNNTVFRIHSTREDRHLLKLKSFGDYTGQGFATAPSCDILFYEKESSAYLPGFMLLRKGAVHSDLRIETLMGTYAAPYYLSPQDAVMGTQGLTVTDTRVTGDGRSSYTVYYYPDRPGYEATTAPEYLPEPDLREFVYRHYTELDGETAADLVPFVESLGEFATTTEAIEWVAAYLRENYTLDADYDPALDSEPNAILAYLDNYKRGSVRHMAAAATLIYRAMGIPARYTVGYLTETVSAVTPVLGSDAYAWVEVYVEGFGWAPVDIAARETQGEARHEVTLKPVDILARYDGSPVEHDGRLEGFEAFEAKGYTYEATVQGKRGTCGTSVTTIKKLTIYDGEGRDVTERFTVETRTGTLTVYLTELTFGGTAITKVYDGRTPSYGEDVTLLSGTLPEGYVAEIIPSECPTAVGTGYAAFDVRIWYEQGKGKRVDRTSYFLISKQYGTVTITPAPLTVKADDGQKTYDGTPLTANGMELLTPLAEGDTVESFTVEGSQTRVGRSENTVTEIVIRNARGEDVTRCYAIEAIAGTLCVVSP